MFSEEEKIEETNAAEVAESPAAGAPGETDTTSGAASAAPECASGEPAETPRAGTESGPADSAAEDAPAAEESAKEGSEAEEAPAAEESAKEGSEAEEAPGGENPAAAESGAESADPALVAALEEAARWKDRAARLQADFDNYRKRQAREREDVLRQANADLLEELLPVLDQTDTAIAAVSKDATDAAKPFLEGFELVRRTFLNAVAKFGLKPVESPVGKPLDPATSEALSVMKTGQAKPGCVVFESRKGYTLGGKLLRASQVVVEQED